MTGKIKTEDTHYSGFFYRPYSLNRERTKERPPDGERPLPEDLCYFYSFTQEVAVFFDCSNIAEAEWFKNFLVTTLLLEAKY